MAKKKKVKGFKVVVGSGPRYRRLFSETFPSKIHAKVAILDAIHGATVHRSKQPSAKLKRIKRYLRARVVRA